MICVILTFDGTRVISHVILMQNEKFIFFESSFNNQNKTKQNKRRCGIQKKEILLSSQETNCKIHLELIVKNVFKYKEIKYEI